jgi:hypothetical protein
VPVPGPPPPPLSEATAPLADLRLLATRGRLFAVLDSCDSPEVQSRLLDLDPSTAPSLFSGPKAAEYATFAPYLVQCGEELLDWIVETLPDQPWGVFLVTDVDLPALRKHLRTLLVVRHPDDRKMYFRFYDPRVLRDFLPGCTAAELRTVFGPVEAFGLLRPETADARLLSQAIR